MVASIALTMRSRVSDPQPRASAHARSRAHSRDCRACCIRCTARSSCSTLGGPADLVRVRLPPRLSANLLNGVNITPSSCAGLGRKQRLGEIPYREGAALGAGFAAVMRAGSRCFRSKKAGSAGRGRLGETPQPGGRASRPRPSLPRASTRRSPNTATAASPIRSEPRKQFRQQFRADTGRIAHRDPDPRRFLIFLSPRLYPAHDLHIAFNPRGRAISCLRDITSHNRQRLGRKR